MAGHTGSHRVLRNSTGAPGNGGCGAGESFWIDTHDVVIRHMHFRCGQTNVGRRDIIVQQYRNLNAIHKQREKDIEAAAKITL